MKGRKGFTLIELMVVVLIVGILAAVAIPIMRGRIDSAKWSEGKAMMGTVATAIRAYYAEHGEGATAITSLFGNATTALGFVTSDLDGTYFLHTDFVDPPTAAYPAGGALTFSIRLNANSGGNSASKPTTPVAYILTQTGTFAPQ
jgi:prepilin-type N-terminal cleavage/methylation domain-containing protein